MSGFIETLIGLAVAFGLMSLLAVGGANSTIPEMHRIAVEVQHWMNDAQFADMFAIAQLSPGPNVLIVTLIGYHVAGLAGAMVATLAMCGPSAMFAYFVGNLFERAHYSPWPALLQASLVPVAIGLMCASAYILVLTVDQTAIGMAITAAAAVIAIWTNLNPLWALAIGGGLGFAGLVS